MPEVTTLSRLTEAGLRLLAVLPLGLSRWFGKVLGLFNFYLGTRAAKVTAENLDLCFPGIPEAERRLLAKKSLSQTGQTLMEVPAAWLGSARRISRWINKVENEDLLDDAVEAGNGVIVLLPHLGNWEMFNVYFATRGKMIALYQPPRNQDLQSLMAKIRQKFGNELVPTSVKGIARLYRGLAEGRVVTILPDQVPMTGEYAPFFGQPALTDVLVSRLQKKTGARIVCCTVRRESPGFVVSFLEPDERIYSADVRESLAGLNATIEKSISNCVEQYQWEYKRFRERPEGSKKLYKFKGSQDVYH